MIYKKQQSIIDLHSATTNNIGGNKISKIITYIKGYLFSSTSSTALLLPESIRYALTHNEGHIGRQEIEMILSNKEFQAIGLYLTLRYLQKTPQKKQCLEQICTALYHTHGDMYQIINDTCKHFLITREHDSMQAHKLSYFSRIGFNTDDLFRKALDKEPLESDMIPVISLYAGLLGLPMVAKKYPSKPVIFCDPKSGLLLGYCMPHAYFSLVELSITDLQQYTSFAIIDDAIGSGDTLQNIQEILEQGRISKPIFKHIIGMKNFAH